MPELMPCPHCGSTWVMANTSPSRADIVQCCNCYMHGPLCDSEEYAIERWNALPRMSAIIAWQFQAAGAALENQKLRERVEAWEWLDEVETLYGNLGWSFDRKQCAIDELYATLVAARAAIGGI